MRNNIVDALAKRKCNWELFNLQTTMPNGGVEERREGGGCGVVGATIALCHCFMSLFEVVPPAHLVPIVSAI